MDTKVEEEGLRHIEKIEHELGEIKSRTPDSGRAFLNGILSGMGAVVGSIIAVILLGWLLSFFGIIPGLDKVASYLQGVVSNMHR